MGEKSIEELCCEYLDAVCNASHMVSTCGELMSCYAFEQRRQVIHEELCDRLDLDYDSVGEVLGDLETHIGFPAVPVDGDEFSSFKLNLRQYGVKLLVLLESMS